MTTPARIIHVGAETRDTPEPPAGSLGTTMFPRLTVLWNGVPLELLGLAEHLLDADFTSTIGRTKASTRQPTGKPKIGGAKLTFHIADDETAKMMARLLLVDRNPVLTVAFGYDDSASYWTGQVQGSKKPDTRLFGQVRGFKMDTITQTNDSGVRRLVINGMVDRAMALCENTRPRVFEGKTPRQILEALAKAYDIDIQIDDDVPADERMAHMVKTTGMHDLTFVTQVADRMGAHVTFGQTGAASIGAAGAYSFHDRNASPGRESVDRARTLLRISSMGAFYDVSRIEASRPVVIGYGPGCDSGRRGRCDFLASSIQVNASHFVPRTAVTAGTKPGGASVIGKQPGDDGKTTTPYVTMDAQGNAVTETLEMVEAISAEAAQALHSQSLDQNPEGTLPRLSASTGLLAAGALLGSSLAVTAGSLLGMVDTARAARGVAAAPRRMVRGQPSIDLSGKLTSEQLRAASIAAGQILRLTVEMFPGLPHLQPCTPVRIVGTPAHDGLYVIEETRLSFSKGGLTSSHELAPMANLKADAKKSGAPKSAATETRKAEDDVQIVPYVTMDAQGNAVTETLEMVGSLSREASDRLKAAGATPQQVVDAPEIPEAVDATDQVED